MQHRLCVMVKKIVGVGSFYSAHSFSLHCLCYSLHYTLPIGSYPNSAPFTVFCCLLSINVCAYNWQQLIGWLMLPHSKRVQRLASVNFYCIETQKIAFFDLHITAQHASQNSSQYRRNVRCFVLEIALTIQCSVFYIYTVIKFKPSS